MCIYMHLKSLFIAEATIQKQHVNERHLPGPTPIFGIALLTIVENNLIIA